MRVTFTVNGELREADDVWEGESLLYVLREDGPRLQERLRAGRVRLVHGLPRRRHLLRVPGRGRAADGRRVDTVEGLGGADGELHAVQQAYRRRRRPVRLLHAGLLATHDLLARDPDPDDSEIREALAGNLCRCTGYEKIIDAVARPAARRLAEAVLDGCAVATMDGDRTEHAVGHVVVDGARIESVAEGRAPRDLPTRRTSTGPAASRPRLREHPPPPLPVADPRDGGRRHVVRLADRALPGVGRARRGHRCGWRDRRSSSSPGPAAPRWTTTTFPPGGGDLLGAEIEAARAGPAVPADPGSMDLGRSRGGLPPDQVVEEIDVILAATADAIDRHHDPSPDSMLRVGVAPCSPFSVTGDLLEQAAALARDKGVRLHTLAETTDEDAFCRRSSAAARSSTSSRWAGSARTCGSRTGSTSTTRASPPGLQRHRRRALPSSNARLGAGICRTRDLRDAGVPVGLGVDGAASNEAASLVEEVRHSVLFARGRRAAGAHRPRGTGAGHDRRRAGARLGRPDRLAGGKLADLALWRVDTAAHAGIEDPVAALVLGTPPPWSCCSCRGDRSCGTTRWSTSTRNGSRSTYVPRRRR